MRFSWRGKDAMRSHQDWWGLIAEKNQVLGTSATTLAAAWAGPLEVLGALADQPHLAGMRITSVEVEATAKVDDHPGARRNHDLLLEGTAPAGDKVVVCLEAKAGETLGATVAEQLRSAAKAKEKNEASNATARVQGLVKRFCGGHDPGEERVQLMRYQLLTALAGTISDAEQRGAQHAVLMVHEFLTPQRPNSKVAEVDVDLHRWATTVLDCELPAGERAPWCVEVEPPEGMAARLYVARAVTDLRERSDA